MKMRWRVAVVIVCVAALSYCADNRPDLTLAEKPVIYLYPEQAQEVSVRLDYYGRLTDTIPAYGDGWKVTACARVTEASGEKVVLLVPVVTLFSTAHATAFS
mgnify:CR=1 FL=1